MSRAGEATIAVGTELFAERGCSDGTIRDIACRANVSPAMIIKCFGSKQDLSHEAATVKPLALPDVPDAELGETLVRDDTVAGALVLRRLPRRYTRVR